MTGPKLREWLKTKQQSQRGMARKLGINERTMRRWCASDEEVPRMAVFAMNWVVFKNL